MKEQNETTPIPYPADPADTKRQLLIFLLVAYGVTYAMGILTWYGNAVSAELSAFPNAQMNYPAAGVMLVGKKPSELAKGMLFAAMVETYAVLALLVSFLMLNGIQI